MEGDKQYVSSLEGFRKLLSSEDLENIPSGLNENEYLMRFLRFKSEPKRAYETFMKYHKFRNSDKELFSKMRPSALKPLIDKKIVSKLPGNDVEGRPVVLVCCKGWNPRKVSVEDVLFVVTLFFEEINRRQQSSVGVIIDWEGFGFSIYRQLTYRNLVRAFALLQGTFPISFTALHQVNQTTMFWLVSKIFFSLLSSKLQKRIHLHGTDRQSLAEHIPVSSLPVEYGGSSEEDVDSAFMDTMYKNEEYYYKLTEHLIKREIKEKMSSLQALLCLMQSDDLENIPAGIDTDEYLMRFLRFKADPRRAYETLVKYHKFRNKDKKLFSQMQPSIIKHLIDLKIITKLPGPDAEGRPVILICCKRWDARQFTIEDSILTITMFYEEINRNHGTSVAVITDWEGFGFSHYRQLSYRNLTRSFAIAQNAIPISFKAIHHVNQSSMFWLVYKILFSVLSAKLQSRFHLHGTDKQSLAAQIPLLSLPVEYGGASEEECDNAFIEKMFKNDEYYDKLNEKLRLKCNK